MINYRKASAECREAYFKYLETSSGQSAASFVAGWNAAMASMGFEHDEKICSMEATQFDNAECIHSDEPAKESEPEYREPVLPADAGERCEFSNDGNEWRNGWLDGYLRGYAHSGWRDTNGVCWQHARIKTNP